MSRNLTTITAALERYRAALASEVPDGTQYMELLASIVALYAVHGRPFGEKGLKLWLEYETWTTGN